MREDFGWSVKRIRVGIFLVELEWRDGRTECLHNITYRFRLDFALDASRENMQH